MARRGDSRKSIFRVAAATFSALALAVAPAHAGTEDEPADTVAPFNDVTAGTVPVAVNLEGGEAIELNITLDVVGLEAGTLAIEPELGNARFLLTLTSEHQDIVQVADSRLEWRCPTNTCAIAATARLDAFTDVDGEIFIGAFGGVTEGEPAPEAAATIRAGDPLPGRARAYELAHSLLEYPDNADQAPHGGLELIEYDLGDPSDEIELVLRPMLGAIELEGATGDGTPTWATGLIPIERTSQCAPTCTGTAVIRLGPSDFSNLEYQVIAYSTRPGVGGLARVERSVATAITEIGFVTMGPDRLVAAIPITLSEVDDQSRLMAGVGVRGRSSFVNLRPVGETAFDPAAAWIKPEPGQNQFELAISTPDARAGEVEISWNISLFELAEAAPTGGRIEVGEAATTAFAAGQPGDPAQFGALDATGDGEASVLPWVLGGLGIAGVAGLGGYRYSRRRQQ